MKRRVVFLHDNMIDEHGKEIFQAEIPYAVLGNVIVNEDNLAIHIQDIWVDYRLEHKEVSHG